MMIMQVGANADVNVLSEIQRSSFRREILNSPLTISLNGKLSD